MTEAAEVFRSLSQGRYQIQQQLGNNGGRRTLLAYDHEAQAPVVIKLLTFDAEFEWDDLKLFEREAETLKSLSHPQIPRLLDFFEIDSPDEKCVALVQSYIPGCSLADYLQAGRSFTEAEIKQLMTVLLEILAYLHRQSPPVVHRDIKPSNIILGDRSGNSIGGVFLVDFGSVQTLVNANDHTVTIVGTYGHMPPEQFAGRTVPASDLYSVGVTAIALATQKSPTELPQKDLRIQFESSAQLNPAFTNWLKQMTAPNVGDRFPSSQAALNALKNLQQWNNTQLSLHQSNSTLKLIKPSLLQTSVMAAVIYGFVATAPLLIVTFFGVISISLFGGNFSYEYVFYLVRWLIISSTFGLVVSSLAYLGAHFAKRPYLYQRFVVAGSILTAGTIVFVYCLTHSPSPQHYYDSYKGCISVEYCSSYNVHDDPLASRIWFAETVIYSVIAAAAAGFLGWLLARWYRRHMKEDLGDLKA